MKTRFVLINTSHAGNVGAAARAIKVMGFDDLVLVAPRWANVLRREETIARASGALDVLRQARVVDTLDQALDGTAHLCATAMTPRDFGPPTRSPRQHFKMLLNQEHCMQYGCGLSPYLADYSEAGRRFCRSALGGVALLFGSERFGLSNEDIYRCHVTLQIPTDPQFGSLNLGAAIQVIAYEWRLALGGFGAPAGTAATRIQQPADAVQVAGLLAHWQQALQHLGFLDPTAPRKLLPRLNQIANRAQLSDPEIHILRGIARAVLQSTPPNFDRPARAGRDCL